MGDTSECAWKMVDSDKFVLGVSAERCGEVAVVKILRPNRKTDLFLCEHHLNRFIQEWGLHNSVEILCQETGCPCPYDCDGCHDGDGVCWRGNPDLWEEQPEYPGTCVDPDCKKCLQDDSRTWRHQ